MRLTSSLFRVLEEPTLYSTTQKATTEADPAFSRLYILRVIKIFNQKTVAAVYPGLWPGSRETAY